ncbi:MAG TPA: ABC transporter ATP-binding protein, partial [Bacteroidia bacterium]|nr:ABC transporter ATP-binding protein [Bacteroidia bacterium]
AVLAYEGTVVIVSHDRDFLTDLTEKMYEFKNGKVKEHLGGIAEFMEKLKMDRLSEMNSKSPFLKPKEETKVEKPKVDTRNDEREKEIKQLKSAITKSEKEIERLENEIGLFDKKLADPDQYQTVMNDKAAFSEYEKMKKQLETEMQNWEALQAKLEQ